MIGKTTGCRRDILCKEIEQVKLIHEMLDHRQYIDLFEPCFKLLHSASSFRFKRRFCEYLRHQAQNVINGASIMYGIEHEISFVADAETAINSAELISQVRNVCLEVGFEEDVLFPGVTILHKIANNKLKEHVAIEM